MGKSPLQRAREQRGLSQQAVADLIRNDLGPARGYSNLGIDANAVSRHERGIIAMPRAPYPELYAALYSTTTEALWAATIAGMRRRTFLRAVAATPVVAMLGSSDMATEAITAVTGGFRRLEATTPARELRGPVLAHLGFVAGRLDGGGKAIAAAASEAAGFAAWLAFDQYDYQQARKLYGDAVRYADRAGIDVLAAYMLGSSSLWAAETGNGAGALDLIGRAGRHIPHAVPPTVTAWLAAIEATAHASLRDADAALAALKRASSAVGSDHDPTWPWLYPFDAVKLAGYVGACATKLKLPKTAIPALTDALPAEPTKQRALVLADLSTNHAALGQLDQARAYAYEAASIAQQRASTKLAQRIPQLA